MSSTTDYSASAPISSMTAAQARYHLTRARERIASLVALLDDERKQNARLRRDAIRLRRILADVRVSVSAIDERSD